jgi:hypothetical protein
MVSQPMRQTQTAQPREAGGILMLLVLLASIIWVQVWYWHVGEPGRWIRWPPAGYPPVALPGGPRLAVRRPEPRMP